MNLKDEIGTNEDLIRYRMQTAREDLQSAIRSLEAGDLRTANNRAYYAVFHAMTACLGFENKGFKTHAQTIGTFNKDFVHTGIFANDMVKKINSIKDVRQLSDYKDYYVLSEDETRRQVELAKGIVPVIGEYVENRIQEEKAGS